MKLACVLAVSLLTFLPLTGFSMEKYFVVKISDHKKDISHQVLSAEEMKMLEQECRVEERLWLKAVAAAEKEWKANESTSKMSFPKAAFSPKKVTAGMQFGSRDEAEEKLAKIVDGIAKKEAKEASGPQPKKNSPAAQAAAKRDERDRKKEEISGQALSMIEKYLAEGAAAAGAKSGPQEKDSAPEVE